MAWLCVDEDGDEMIFDNKPKRDNSPTCGGYWSRNEKRDFCNVDLPKGTIKKLIGKDLTWKEEPYEYTGDVDIKKNKRKPNWSIGLLSIIWSFLAITLGNIAWKTGPLAVGAVVILTAIIFYFGYKDIDINENSYD